jgi:hypothetical protein
VLGLTNGPIGTVPAPRRLMSKFFHGQVVILYKSNDDVAFLTTYSLLRIDIASTWSRFGRAVCGHFVPTQRSCWGINRVNSSFQSWQIPPAVLCRRCPQCFVWRCMWPDYRKLIYSVLLKRHFKELIQYCPQLSRFRGAGNWVIVWFDSLSSRPDSRESLRTCVVWYFDNAISGN